MRAVVDTNVLLVANGAHDDAGETCRAACTAKLAALAKRGVVVIDDAYQIVEEYLRKTRPRTGKHAGDAFLKWLLNNQANPKRVERVVLAPTGARSYAQVDALNLPHKLDPSDRKFVAVAAGARRATPIIEATDCKWLDWWQDLAAAGVAVEFVCREEIVRFYRRKFPTRSHPSLP